MNFKKYLIDSIWKIIYFVILLFIINITLFVSNSISQSLNDLVYLNILIIIISLLSLFFGYYRWFYTYRNYKFALDNKKALKDFLPNNNNFESQLLRDTVKFKNNQLYEETKELYTRLEEINNYITQWIHEIKIPIAVCELICDKLDETMAIDNLETIPEDIKMELERIKFLIDQVLYASRSSIYSEDLSIEEISLEKIVKASIKKKATFFISKKVSISLDNLDFIVMTDKKWISYILSQLLNNAYKYVRENGEIHIFTSEDEKSIKLHIKDNGIGIKPKDIKRIFDKGFTGDNGRNNTRSTGMGLYFTKKMIDRLSHSILVSSEENRYTEFTIVFYKLSDYLRVTKM